MLTFVPTPLGNLGDISLNALLEFSKATSIICEDTRVTKRLLELLKRDEFIISKYPSILESKKFYSFHSHNEKSFLDSLNPSFFIDEYVVFCTDAGMPCISDPGASLIRYARDNNIKFNMLLGGSAFNLAFALSALEGEFKFIGFLPHKSIDRISLLKNLDTTCNNIFYESPKRLFESLKDIDKVLPNAIIYAYKELTKMHQSEFIGTPKELLKLIKNINGEWCLILKINSLKTKCISLSKDDILNLDIQNKQKAKLLAKLSNFNAKRWYEILENKELE